MKSCRAARGKNPKTHIQDALYQDGEKHNAHDTNLKLMRVQAAAKVDRIQFSTQHRERAAFVELIRQHQQVSWNAMPSNLHLCPASKCQKHHEHEYLFCSRSWRILKNIEIATQNQEHPPLLRHLPFQRPSAPTPDHLQETQATLQGRAFCMGPMRRFYSK